MDEMQKDINDIKIDVAEIKLDLKYHMKRTATLEERQDQFSAAILPLVGLKDEIKGAVKFIKIVALLAGIAESISLILRHT